MEVEIEGRRKRLARKFSGSNILYPVVLYYSAFGFLDYRRERTISCDKLTFFNCNGNVYDCSIVIIMHKFLIYVY